MPLTSKAKINTAIQQKYESLEVKESAELMTLAKALQSNQTAHDVAVEADDNSIMSGILIYMGNIYVFYAVRFENPLGSFTDIEEKTLELDLKDFVPEIYSRLEEACRRIDDKDNFGQFSMEGIGQSVGFNSRSTFNAAFKRVTGFTPSEYQREARKT